DHRGAVDVDAGCRRARAEFHTHMPVGQYAHAVLRQLRKARFLEDALIDALIRVVQPVPSYLRLHRDMRRIERITIENDNSPRPAIKQGRRVAALKAWLPEGDSATAGPIVSVP